MRTEGLDTVKGGEGDDHITGSNLSDKLYGDGGDDTLVGGDEFVSGETDHFYGGDGNDVIRANNSTVQTQGDGDVVFGGNGDDDLLGGELSDTLIGGSGADNLAGGGGDDVFRFDGTGESITSSKDVITDFGSGDLIDLRTMNVSFSDLVFTEVAGDTDVSLSGTSFQFRILGDHGNLSADDFLF